MRSTASHQGDHRPVWPLGLCAAHANAASWPCGVAVVELVSMYGDGWQLAAHLWDQFEDAVRLLPTMALPDLRELVIVRPLNTVDAWARAPRVVGHWSEVA
ncbi:hypothetical protein Areg01_23920 [Actinoplanes regularis]|nr:hypothetical protein Areg01_23920 [Actinoplanes regularis]